MAQLLVHSHLIVVRVVLVVEVHCLQIERSVVHINCYLFGLHGHYLSGLDCDFEVLSTVDDHGRLEEAQLRLYGESFTLVTAFVYLVGRSIHILLEFIDELQVLAVQLGVVVLFLLDGVVVSSGRKCMFGFVVVLFLWLSVLYFADVVLPVPDVVGGVGSL